MGRELLGDFDLTKSRDIPRNIVSRSVKEERVC